MNLYLFATVMGAALLVTTGIVPIIFEGRAGEHGNQTSPSSNSTSSVAQDMASKVAKFGASGLMALLCISIK